MPRDDDGAEVKGERGVAPYEEEEEGEEGNIGCLRNSAGRCATVV